MPERGTSHLDNDPDINVIKLQTIILVGDHLPRNLIM